MDERIIAFLDRGGDSVSPLRSFLRPAEGRPGGLVFDPLIGVGAGPPHHGAPRQVSAIVLQALHSCDEALQHGDLSLVDVRLGFQKLAGKDLEALAHNEWFKRVEQLDLSGNRVSGKTVAAVAATGASLRGLKLDHIKLGKSVGKLGGLASLESLSVNFSGIDAVALQALVGAQLPKLSQLSLWGFGQHCTKEGLQKQVTDRRLDLAECGGVQLAPLFDAEHAARWRSLRLGYVNMPGDRGFSTGALPSLERLELRRVRLDEDADGAILALDLPRLAHLERDGGFALSALQGRTWLPQLETLTFDGCDELDDQDLAQLLAATVKLTALHLTRAGVGAETAAALAKLGAPLAELRLMHNLLSDADVCTLMAAPWAKQLRALGLSGNPVRASGVRAVAQSGSALGILGLSHAELEDQEIDPLLNAGWLPNCRALGLANNRLTDASADRLAALDWAEGARVFLEGNALSRAKARQLEQTLGARVRGVQRQYAYKSERVRAPQLLGGGGVVLEHLAEVRPAVAIPVPAIDGIEFFDAVAGSRVFVGTQGDRLAVVLGPVSDAQEIELDEVVMIPDRATVKFAAGVTGCKDIAVALGGQPLTLVSDSGGVTKLDRCAESVHAVACDGVRLLLADAPEIGVPSRLRSYGYQHSDEGWHWVLQDSLQLSDRVSCAALVQGNPAALLGVGASGEAQALVVGFVDADLASPQPDPVVGMGLLGRTPLGVGVQRRTLFDGEHHFLVQSVAPAMAQLRLKLRRERGSASAVAVPAAPGSAMPAEQAAPAVSDPIPDAAPDPMSEAAPEATPVKAASIEGRSYLFTGTLESCSRKEANALVEARGGTVANSVTKTLDVLVVGAGRGQKSSKQKKAESLVAAGATIEIVSEKDFLASLGR